MMNSLQQPPHRCEDVFGEFETAQTHRIKRPQRSAVGRKPPAVFAPKVRALSPGS